MSGSLIFDHFLFLVSDVSESLRLPTKNERPWAICSGRSEEMNDRELIAQVAHQKWANEWIAHRSITHFWEKNERFARKTDDRIPSPA